jgi:hypothetical protein
MYISRNKSGMDNLQKMDLIANHCNAIVNRDSFMLRERFGVVGDQLQHIAQIGASIVMHKAGLRSGGGFVEAVCDNNLVSAAGRADSTKQTVLAYMAVTFADRWGNIEYESTKQ